MLKSAFSPFTSFFFAMVALVITFIVSMTALRSLSYSPLRVVLVMLPIFPSIWGGVSFSQGVGKLDELQKRIQLEAIAFSLATTSLSALGIGLMQFYAPFPFNSLFFVLLAVILWGMGIHIANKKYQ